MKPHRKIVVKWMAIFMAAFYVVQPLYHQIITVFHDVSHSIDIDSVDTHSHGEEEHVHGHHFDDHHETTSVNHHEHDLLDFVYALLKTSSQENDSDGKSILKDSTLKKHLPEELHYVVYAPPRYQHNEFACFDEAILKGFLHTLEPPPKI